MILARIVNSLRRQDWATVAVEFILVVAGVLVALQLDNWNQQRIAQREFRSELALIQAELRENRERLNSFAQRMEENLSLLAEFQRAFHDENLVFSDEKRETFVRALTLTGDYGQLIRSTGVDRLLDSDSIVQEQYETLRRSLERWNLVVNGFRGITLDRYRFGTEVILPLFTESHSLVPSAERWLRDTPYRLEWSTRPDVFETVLADPRVENSIAYALITEYEVLQHVRILVETSEVAIAEIDRLLAEPSG